MNIDTDKYTSLESISVPCPNRIPREGTQMIEEQAVTRSFL